MSFKQIQMALYALYLTNKFGFKFKKISSNSEKKKLRIEYGETLLSKLNIEVIVKGIEKVDPNGQYLLISNHRSIIDPCIIEVAFKNTNIFGLWVSKKELYNSFFFGKFVRNSGTILLDRESSHMGQFFKAIKEGLNQGSSIFVFPEGTRNKENTELAEFKEGSQLI
ncbi:MAG: 1-acyl-sn-glycerol-3-phosphate acyltransferase, partial [Gammaproteobacteria bacterium]|nr:1-acyl-sn-glycerol-3-phosphate acyltransferase [Gammaproteobacteria bacterium]